MKKLIAAVLVCCALVVSRAEAQLPCSPVRVTVAEPDRTVTGLSAKDFAIKVQGNIVSVQEAEMRSGNRFILVLDASGSMSDPEGSRTERVTWTLLLQMAKSIVDVAPNGYSIGLLTFSDKVERRVRLTDERRLVYEALEREWQAARPPYGKTSLWDALHEAVEMLAPVQDGDFIVVISDGGDNASKAKFQDIQAELAARRIRLFPVTLSNGPGTQEELAGPEEMQDLAEHSGGAALNLVPWVWLNHSRAKTSALVPWVGLNRSPVETSEFLASTAGRLIALSTYSYALTLDVPTLEKRAKLQIELSDRQSGRKKRRLLYQRDIGPCGERVAQP